VESNILFLKMPHIKKRTNTYIRVQGGYNMQTPGVLGKFRSTKAI
jgi:hypothetical protein